MTTLLDSSMLIAAAFQDHLHYQAADEWLTNFDDSYATCPITQGALIRSALRAEYTMADALELLEQITTSDRHEFWPDDIDFGGVPAAGIIGHRQVTDAYLAQLARGRSAQVVTLDRGFAALHADVAELVSTG